MNRRLLIVDDSPVMCQLLSEVLANDYKTSTCNNGYEALDHLATNQVNAIVLDLTMPEMGGVEFLKHIRSINAYSHIPVLVLSGHYESLTRIAAIEAGANDFMTKPFNPLELQLRLSRILTAATSKVQNTQQLEYTTV